MDNVDYKILEYLKANSRTKASTISKEIHLSVSAVIERIHKLETSGIIKNYTVVLDESKIGNDTSALMEVSLDHPKFYESFTRAIKENKNINFCYYLTGDFDFMLKILCKSSEDLEKIHNNIKNLEGVSKTKTYYILKSVKD
ncbi:Lrp/AsnC family transcriptional regulator [Clostridium guangxiense]|uniref:Lrp/AsnC family transcriptional regulator n=1 Tax=Clostridium guangxiense TaxID=1662055 RepID=UPI001E58958F|nr:Lrp/AsnC family transcriptional regulator [Clostridium guangxiense]MCD2347814.1 Lrp/AsnC family transcriptional regulator [Clostridium guangxiense]